MITMMMNGNMKMSNQMAEDVNAPELRNPIHSAMRPRAGWLARLLGLGRK